MGRYYDLANQFVIFYTGSIDGDDVAIEDEGRHGIAFDSQAQSGFGIRAPLNGRGQHGIGRDFRQIDIVSFMA